jgi:hypothetical protein
VGLDNDRSSSKGLDLGCSPRAMMLTAVLLVLACVGLWLISREPSAEQIARSRLAIERAEALQPWTIALGVALRGVAIAAGVVLLMGLVMAVRSAARWLDTQSRLIRPDSQTGQFPAVKVRRGEAVVDLNRLPDGKAMTGVVGGKTALLLVLFLRYVLGKDVPELTEQPAILIRPPDTSPEQMRVTAQAQVGQALAAASRGMTPGDAVQAAQALLPQHRTPPGLPPLLVEGRQPREVQLLLAAGRRHWDRSQADDVVDGTTHLLEGG